jgi:hypothetical protein
MYKKNARPKPIKPKPIKTRLSKALPPAKIQTGTVTIKGFSQLSELCRSGYPVIRQVPTEHAGIIE